MEVYECLVWCFEHIKMQREWKSFYHKNELVLPLLYLILGLFKSSVILCHYTVNNLIHSHTFYRPIKCLKRTGWEASKMSCSRFTLLCAITPNHTYVSQSCGVCVSDVDYIVPITSARPALTLWSASNLHSCLVISITPLW